VSSHGGGKPPGADLIPKLAELKGKLQEQLVERDKLQARADNERKVFDRRKKKAQEEHAEAGAVFVESDWLENERAPYEVPADFLEGFHALHYEIASVESELSAIGYGATVPPASSSSGSTALEAEE
jgi:hypothetical protein